MAAGRQCSRVHPSSRGEENVLTPTVIPPTLAIAKAATSQGLTNPARLDRVMTTAGKTLTVDAGAASLTDWIFVLKGIGAEHMTLLNTNGGAYASLKCPDGSSCQKLTPDSELMFATAMNDTLPAFIRQHPTWVAPDK